MTLKEFAQYLVTKCIGTTDISKIGDGTIKGAIASQNDALANGKISFGIDSDGNYGYIKDGADSVIPFKSILSDVTCTVSLYGYTYSSGEVGSIVTMPCAGYSKLYATVLGKNVKWYGIKSDGTSTQLAYSTNATANSTDYTVDISDYVAIQIDTSTRGSTFTTTITFSN
jgi:hypothetical protein